jgi:hypothetical protein
MNKLGAYHKIHALYFPVEHTGEVTLLHPMLSLQVLQLPALT